MNESAEVPPIRMVGAEWLLMRITADEAKEKLLAAVADPDDLARVFQALDAMPRDGDEARERLLVGWCQAIAEERLAPAVGASLIAEVMAGTDWAEDVSPLIALASDWESDVDNRSLYEEQIRRAVTEVLESRRR